MSRDWLQTSSPCHLVQKQQVSKEAQGTGGIFFKNYDLISFNPLFVWQVTTNGSMISYLTLKLTPDDDGGNLTCRAENPEMALSMMEVTKHRQVHC